MAHHTQWNVTINSTSWIDETCEHSRFWVDALIDEEVLYSHYGAVPNNFHEPAHRITLLRNITSTVIDGGSLDSQSAMDYALILVDDYAAGGIVLAVIAILLWLPLWITRCCMPHKCCQPKPEYTSTEKHIACGSCGFVGLVLVILFGVSFLFSYGATDGIYHSICGMDALQAAMIARLEMYAKPIVVAQTACDQAIRGLDGLATVFGMQSTAAAAGQTLSTACDSATSAQASLNHIYVLTTSHEGAALTGTTELNELNSALTAVADITCTTLPGLLPHLQAVSRTLTQIHDVMVGVSATMGSIIDVLDQMKRMFVDVRTEFALVAKENWQQQWPLAGIVALTFIPVWLLLLPPSFGGAMCLYFCRSKRGRSSGHGFTMCALVSFSLTVVLLFLFAALIHTLGAVSSDVGTIILHIPRHLETVAPTLCASANVPLSSGGGAAPATFSGCGVIERCFATPSVDLITQLVNATGFTDSIIDGTVDALLAQSALETEGPPVNASLYDEAEANTHLAAHIPWTAFSLNVTVANGFSMEEIASVNDDITDIVAKMSASEGPLGELARGPGVWAIGNATLIVSAVHTAVVELEAIVNDDTTFGCGWMRDSLDDIVNPALRGHTPRDLGDLSIMMQVIGCLGLFLFVPALVLLQMRLYLYEHVGQADKAGEASVPAVKVEITSAAVEGG